MDKYFCGRVLVADNGCWIWLGSKTDKGYGQARISGKKYRAHRLSYELHIGAILTDMFVCHTCDVPECVNPEHLFIGTNQDNVNDREMKGRGNQACGYQNGNAKLKDCDVLDIISKKGILHPVMVAKEFGIHISYVYRLWNGERRA